MIKMIELQKLVEWYQSLCDGDWEHMYGIDIHTIDRPGWSVIIDLGETNLESVVIEMVEDRKSETDWYLFFIKNKQFHAAGDMDKLPFLIGKFIEVVSAFEDG